MAGISAEQRSLSRQLVEQANTLYERLLNLAIPSQTEQKELVGSLVQEARKDMAVELLDTLDATSLGINASTAEKLKQAGYHHPSEVLTGDTNRIVKRIGKVSAEKLASNVQNAYDQALGLMPLSFDSERQPASQTRALHEAILLDRLSSYRKKQSKLLEALDDLQRTKTALATIPSFPAILFIGKKKQDDIVNAIDTLQTALLDIGGNTIGLETTIEHDKNLTQAEVWSAYATNRDAIDTIVTGLSLGPDDTRLPHRTTETTVRLNQLIKSLDDTLEQLNDDSLPTEEELVERVKSLSSAIREEATLSLLETVDVTVLERKGIQPSVLTKKGFTNIRSLVDAESSSLANLRPKELRTVVSEEVTRMHDQAYDLVPCSFDTDEMPETHSQLVETLALLDGAKPYQVEHNDLANRIESLKEEAKEIEKRAINNGEYFVPAGTHDRMETEVDSLTLTMDSLRDEIASHNQSTQLALSEFSSDAWNSYRANQQNYNDTLQALTGAPATEEGPLLVDPLLEKAEDLHSRADSLVTWISAKHFPSSEEQKQRVTELANELRSGDVRQLLEQLSVSALGLLGVQYANLLDAGINNFSQLIAISQDELSALIPKNEATTAITSAKRVWDNVFANTPCIIKRSAASDTEDALVLELLLLQRLPQIRGFYTDISDEVLMLDDACSNVLDTIKSNDCYFVKRTAWKSLSAKLDPLEERVIETERRIQDLASFIPEQDESTEDAWGDYLEHQEERDRLIRSLTKAPMGLETPELCVGLATRALSAVRRYDKLSKEGDELFIPTENAETNRAKEYVTNLKKSEARRRLDGISVEALAYGGARTGPLVSAGFISIGDLVGESQARLSTIQGITYEAAGGIVRAVEDINASAIKSAPVRLSIEERGETQTALLRKLLERELEKPLRIVAADLLVSIGDLKSAAESLRRIPGYLNSLIMMPNKAQSFSSRLEQFEPRLSLVEKNAEDLRAKLDALRSITDDQVWEWFEQDAASRYAEIEQLGGGGTEQATGDLPKRLVDKVAKFSLDTKFLKSKLRGYQKFGTQYALAQKRALIGDEMGLGKTVEAVAAMAHLAANGEDHFMVVCPLSVLINWSREVPKHSKLQAIPIHGVERDRKFNYWRLVGGVAITTYETISKLEWSRVKHFGMLVIDEAHYIKNPSAKRTRSITENLMPLAEHVLLLTGTPLENKVDEMNNLISYLDPSLIRKLDYSAICNPIKYRQSVAPVYLRRRRIDVLNELPQKIEKNDWCALSQVDEKDYRHSLLYRSWHSMRRVGWSHEELSRSSKANRLLEICEEAKESNAKVLIFSYYLDTLEKVRAILKTECAGVITGKVPAAQRQAIIDEFSRSRKTCLVCQVSAGGVGLNIQAASIVVFCEPQIKPSMEEQATSRAYRMGQVRTVVVHRLLMSETVDERVEEILGEKRAQFNMYADESQIGRESLGVIDSDAISRIIEEERKRFGITGGAKKNNLGNPQGSELGNNTISTSTVIKKDISTGPQKVSSSAVNATVTRSASRARSTAIPKRKRRSERFSFSVAGLNKMDTADFWSSGIGPMVSLKREPNNRYDSNAVALYVGAFKAGYVPREDARTIAKLMDQGYEADVRSVSASEHPKKRRRRDEWGDYYYEEDWDHTYTTVSLTVVLTEPYVSDSEVNSQSRSQNHYGESRPFAHYPTGNEGSSNNQALSAWRAEQTRSLLPSTFSPELVQTFVYLAQGMTRPQIAQLMNVSTDTAIANAKTIYKQLRIRNMLGLYSYARKLLLNAGIL